MLGKAGGGGTRGRRARAPLATGSSRELCARDTACGQDGSVWPHAVPTVPQRRVCSNGRRRDSWWTASTHSASQGPPTGLPPSSQPSPAYQPCTRGFGAGVPHNRCTPLSRHARRRAFPAWRPSSFELRRVAVVAQMGFFSCPHPGCPPLANSVPYNPWPSLLGARYGRCGGGQPPPLKVAGRGVC